MTRYLPVRAEVNQDGQLELRALDGNLCATIDREDSKLLALSVLAACSIKDTIDGNKSLDELVFVAGLSVYTQDQGDRTIAISYEDP